MCVCVCVCVCVFVCAADPSIRASMMEADSTSSSIVKLPSHSLKRTLPVKGESSGVCMCVLHMCVCVCVCVGGG